jgi:hypothetical protein
MSEDKNLFKENIEKSKNELKNYFKWKKQERKRDLAVEENNLGKVLLNKKSLMIFQKKEVIKMKKNNIVIFFGRQLSRLRLGQGYYQLIISTISAISLLSLAYKLTIELMIILFPVFFVGSFFLGYLLDRMNISAIDYRKTAEISGRFLNNLDLKNFDMRMIQVEANARAIQDPAFNVGKFMEEKKAEFRKKWIPTGER